MAAGNWGRLETFFLFRVRRGWNTFVRRFPWEEAGSLHISETLCKLFTCECGSCGEVGAVSFCGEGRRPFWRRKEAFFEQLSCQGVTGLGGNAPCTAAIACTLHKATASS